MKEDSQYEVKVNGISFPLSDAALAAADIVKKAPGILHFIKHNRSVTARLLTKDETGKKLTVEVAGETFTVEIKDQLDQTLDSMGFSKAVVKLVREIKAPMPGMVLEVAVNAGQAVKEGDKLLILGAMKMENSIVVHADAVVKRVAVNVGQAVDKGQLLIELE